MFALRKFLFVLMFGHLSACATPQVDDIDYRQSEPMVYMTSDGVGTISAGTSYSQSTLTNALPQFEMGTVKTISEGQLKHLYAAFSDGMQQLQFEPNRAGNKVWRVHMVGQEAAGPNGERIGMTFARSGGGNLICVPGTNQWSSMALCNNSEQTLTYIYAPQEYSGPPDKLPPRDILAKALLVRIIWSATP